MAEEKRTMIPEDLYALRAAAEPQLSADGRFAANLVIHIDRERDGYLYELHVTDVNVGTISVISGDAGKFRSPRFSPDGRSLAWIVATDSDGEHVYVADTGALLSVSELSISEHSDPSGQPNSGLSESSDALPEVSVTDLFSKKRLGQEVFWLPNGSGLLVSEVSTNLTEVKEYRNVYFKTDGVGLLPDVTTHFWMVSLTGDAQNVYARQSGVSSIAVSPSGKEFAFTVQQSPETGSFKSDIYILDTVSSDVRRLTDSEGPIRSITYSPNGEFIAWIGHQSVGRYGTESLWATNVESGQSHAVLVQFDRPVGVQSKGDVSPVGPSDRPQFSADGNTLYFAAQDGGPTHLYKVEFPTGVPVRVTEDSDRCVSHFSVNQEGQILFVSSNPSTPEEIYLLRDGSEERISGINESFCEQVNLAEAKRMLFNGADGWPIEGWLMLPPSNFGGKAVVGDAAVGRIPGGIAGAAETDSGAPYPLVLLIHGGPHGAFGCAFQLKAQVLSGAGFAVLYVNPRGSQAYGTDFAAAVIGDWGGKDFEDIMNAVDKVVEDGLADGSRMGVTGYSYGGFMTTWTIGHTDRFRAAAAGGCVSNLISFHGTSDIGKNWGPLEHRANVYDGVMELWNHSPLAYVKNVTTPTMLYHAEGDDRCPIGQSEEYYTALRNLGKEAVFVRYPGGSHGYSSAGKPSFRVDTNERLTEWFKQKLGVRAAFVQL